MGWVVDATPQSLYPWERDPIPIIQEAESVLGPLRMGAENLAPHWDSIHGPLSLQRVAIPKYIHTHAHARARVPANYNN